MSPPGFMPQFIESETHLSELERSLEKTGHLYGKKLEPTFDFPHQDLIVLKYDDIEESSRSYEHLDAQWEKGKAASNPNLWEAVKANTVVFTSLPLLYNLCSSAKLGWEVCGHPDSTHGLLSNDYYMVIGFGVYHVGPDRIKLSHPLAYALATGELELVSLLLLHYLKRVALAFFRLTPQFKCGIISDHTEVFVNAFQEIFPNNQVLLQYFRHIIWKF
jgi:hypothetical protein